LFVTLTSRSKILPWKICCIECVKILQDKEFDILYNDMVETDDAIRAWLEVKQKKKGHSYMILAVVVMAIRRWIFQKFLIIFKELSMTCLYQL